MPISFACAVSHAPGITAWAEAANSVQRDNLYDGYAALRDELVASKTDVLVVLTSEHWANFFLDHISAFCIGRGLNFEGPVEPWLRVEKSTRLGDVPLASQLIESLYDASFEPSFSEEMELDHGTMVPLHFLDPGARCAMVPIMFNTLASPQPSARRSVEFGRVLGAVARQSPRRIGFVATGGLSHDPGERGHGRIVESFDRQFLKEMVEGDLEALSAYSHDDFAAAGAGAFELLAWAALAGALDGIGGKVLAYEPVEAWATGMGLVSYAAGISNGSR